MSNHGCNFFLGLLLYCCVIFWLLVLRRQLARHPIWHLLVTWTVVISIINYVILQLFLQLFLFLITEHIFIFLYLPLLFAGYRISKWHIRRESFIHIFYPQRIGGTFFLNAIVEPYEVFLLPNCTDYLPI